MTGITELRSIEELEAKLSQHKILWNEIAPLAITEWLETFSKSYGCTKELLLVNMLACTSALIGDASIKLFETWKEYGNLFLIALAPSGIYYLYRPFPNLCH